MEIHFNFSPAMKVLLERALECQRLVLPVMLNILLTLVCWVYVYEMKIDDRLVGLLFGNTGETLSEALLNGLCSSLLLVVVAFVLLTLAMWDLRRIVQFWLYSSCILLLFIVSGHFFLALFLGPNVTEPSFKELSPVLVATVLYGGLGLATYFTGLFPPSFHRFYVVVNCSLVSQYYLRCFPGHTAWVVLVSIALWDIFAVLSPYGPLKMVQSKAKDYSANVLRFLMFSANDDSSECKIVSENSNSNSEDSSLSELSSLESSSSSTSIEVVEPLQTAEEALNDSSLKLGMGDFVFYSVLAGKSACSRSVLATVGCVFGIIYGLMMTLIFFSSDERTTPALPISIFLGIFLHLVGLHLEPILDQLLHTIIDIFAIGF